MGPVNLAGIEASIIKVNGDIIEVKPAEGQYFNLKELREHIGCDFIELVHLMERSNPIGTDGEAQPLPILDMVIDEQGKLTIQPINAMATEVWRRYYPFSHDFIVGNAIILKPKYLE